MKRYNLVFIILISTSLCMYACGGSENSEEDEKFFKDEDASEDDFVFDDAEAIDEEAIVEEESESTSEKATGTFEGIEEDEYRYFLVKIDKGEVLSLIVENPDEVFEKVKKDPENFKGKKVTVQWESKTEPVEEAGGTVKRLKYIKAEFE